MKYGFVYIWRDKKHNRYYIGSHWGTEDDGYICSSNWMRDAYRRRPEDFKRKILESNIYSKEKQFVREEMWLYLIKEEKLGKRYYNLKKTAKMPPSFESKKHTDAAKKKISITHKGNKPWNKNNINVYSQDTIIKMSKARLGWNPSIETRQKMSESKKGEKNMWYGTSGPMKGKKSTEETKIKLRNLIWITNNIESKRIQKDVVIPTGWRKGRIKFW